MSTITLTLPADGQTIDASDVNNPFNTIATEINGNLNSANVIPGGLQPQNLVSGTGTSWAAQTWAPTWANLTAGNGTLNYAKYTQVGKTVTFWLSFTLGSTSAVGTAPTFTLPVTASGLFANAPAPIGLAMLVDTSTGEIFNGFVLANSATTAKFVVAETATTYGRLTILTSLIPMTWASTDIIWLQGTFEAA